MQPGNLVKITRASIGVPLDTIGLIVKVDRIGSDWNEDSWLCYNVQICNAKQRTIRRLERDLEVI